MSRIATPEAERSGRPFSVPVLPIVIGGKYRAERVVARGGMGVILRARHMRLGHRVAIKLLDRGFSDARWTLEAASAARLIGEHVVRMVDADEMPDGTPYLVMEWLDGIDLATLIEREGPITPARAVDYVLQTLAALAEAHVLGIVHRDVKPSNLFLAKRAEGREIIKLLDFGVSKLSDPGAMSRTATGAVVGTPLFMAPEQLLSAKQADPRSDLWSIGVVLYNLISGALPFEAETATALAASFASIAHRPRPLSEVLPGVDPRLESVVHRCLERDPALRFQGAHELARALAPFALASALGSAARVLATGARAIDGDEEPEVTGEPPPAPGRVTASLAAPIASPTSASPAIPVEPIRPSRPATDRTRRSVRTLAVVALAIAGVAAGVIASTLMRPNETREPPEDASPPHLGVPATLPMAEDTDPRAATAPAKAVSGQIRANDGDLSPNRAAVETRPGDGDRPASARVDPPKKRAARPAAARAPRKPASADPRELELK
jgi:serine/threonine protein kinase